MFYSNQLLSRKGPFAQIWIAATMHAKINRRQAEKVDIAEVCDQILNPVVPLALRLSGILMGGVVLIYDRKVKFLSEDVNNLMIQIKHIAANKKSDASSLSKEKSKARFESITIEYEEYNELEIAMLQAADDETTKRERFFTIGEELELRDKRENLHHRFQVGRDSITIPEDPLQPEFEILISFDNDDRILPPTDLIVDDMCPEYQLEDELPRMDVDGMHVEVQQSTVDGSKRTESDTNAPRPSEGSPEYIRPRSKRRQRKRKRLVIDLDFTEVPAPVFNTWLKYATDILANRRDKLKIPKIAGRLTVDHEKNLLFPSSSLSWNVLSGANPLWSPPLIELWNLCTTALKCAKSANWDNHDSYGQFSGHSRGSQTVDVVETEPLFHADGPRIDSREHMKGIEGGTSALNQVDYGSIEKLRSALNTPITKTYDLLINQLGVTQPSGQSGKSKGGLPSATPSSGKLSLDKDEEFGRYSTVRSTVSTRKSRSTGMDMSPGFEMQADDYLKETISTNYGLGNDVNFLGSSLNLSQFVLEETLPSQIDVRSPQVQRIDTVTTSLIGILGERFDQQPIVSSEDLFVGLGRANAAKLFYQICVMASNRFISVDQKIPYEAIFMKRGDRAHLR